MSQRKCWVPNFPLFCLTDLLTQLLHRGTGFSFVQWICTKQNDKQQTFKVPNVIFHFSASLYQNQIYTFCSFFFLFFAKVMFTFYRRHLAHIILFIRLGLFWWKKESLVFHPKPFSQEADANLTDHINSAPTSALICKMLSYSINQGTGSHTTL